MLDCFEGAAHGACDYELDFLRERKCLETGAEFGALGGASKIC